PRDEQLVTRGLTRRSPPAVTVLLPAGCLQQLAGLDRVVAVRVEPLQVVGVEPVRYRNVRESSHVLDALARAAKGDQPVLFTVDRVRQGLAGALVIELRQLVQIHQQRRAAVRRWTDDADTALLERLLGCRREAVRRVVDVFIQDDRGDVRR